MPPRGVARRLRNPDVRALHTLRSGRRHEALTRIIRRIDCAGALWVAYQRALVGVCPMNQPSTARGDTLAGPGVPAAGRLVRATALMCLVAGVALTAGQTPGGQPAPAAQGPETPTFRVQVDYVEVDAVVTDGQGRFVRDLKKEDFEVSEDGKRQTVNAFTLVDIPIERSIRPLFAAQPVEPDVTNQRPSLRRPDLHCRARRSARAVLAFTHGAQRHAQVHPGEAGRQRSDGRDSCRGEIGKLPGIHQQQTAVAGRGRQIHRQGGTARDA